MSEETHILSIRSLDNGTTLYIRPMTAGVIRVDIGINNDPHSATLHALVPAGALLLAATSAHSIVHGVNPSAEKNANGGTPS